jgi:hypothetical protein
MLNTLAKLGGALCLGVVGIGFLLLRHATFYSYDVDRPAEAQHSVGHAGIFVLAGMTCLGLAVTLVRWVYRESLHR